MKVKNCLKKIGLSIVSLYLSIFLLFNSIAFADDEEFEDLELEDVTEIIETSAETENIPEINSRAAVVIDRYSHKILYGKNEDKPRPMASTTKICTCIVVLENARLDDTVTVSKKAGGTGGSRLGLKTNDQITVNDLLYGLMLCSGNDCAVALAEHVGGSVEEFANLMNKKAEELKLKNTHFVTPHGLDSDGHYTTAYELAILADYGLKIDKFKEIVGTKNYNVTINGNSKNINNTNELLGSLNGVYGVKTGFTNGANRCLVTSIKREDLDIICVVLGADTKKFRTLDSVKLIEYSFKNYKVINVESIVRSRFDNYKNNEEIQINVDKGLSNSVSIGLEEIKTKVLPLTSEEERNIEIMVHIQEKVEAPVEENVCIGKMEILIDKKIAEEVDIVTTNSIKRKGISDYIKEFFREYEKINIL